MSQTLPRTCVPSHHLDSAPFATQQVTHVASPELVNVVDNALSTAEQRWDRCVSCDPPNTRRSFPSSQKRSAARSKTAARSALSSSDPVRGCLGDLPAPAILPAAAMRSSSLKSSIGSMGSAKSLSSQFSLTVGRQVCSAKP